MVNCIHAHVPLWSIIGKHLLSTHTWDFLPYQKYFLTNNFSSPFEWRSSFNYLSFIEGVVTPHPLIIPFFATGRPCQAITFHCPIHKPRRRKYASKLAMPQTRHFPLHSLSRKDPCSEQVYSSPVKSEAARGTTPGCRGYLRLSVEWDHLLWAFSPHKTSFRPGSCLHPLPFPPYPFPPRGARVFSSSPHGGLSPPTVLQELGTLPHIHWC